MKVQEFQAKELMRKFGIGVLRGKVAKNSDDAVKAAKKIKSEKWAVKAQILAGGRGKAGGIKIANSIEEVKKYANDILGKVLITPQTGKNGKVVKQVLIEEVCSFENEYYVGIVLDRASRSIIMMVSPEGGMEIEKISKEDPDKLTKVVISPAVGFSPYVGRKLAYQMGIKGENVKKAIRFFEGLYRMYVDLDCTMVEVNPLVITSSNEVVALDAKLTFDDNSCFKHPELLEMSLDLNEHEYPQEVAAQKHGISYIQMGGNIGCLVNGAGLAMSTMDIIKLHGGNPANFLDVGGSATKEAVKEAFSIILLHKSVKAILVNIFGGIMKCDIIAEGVVAAISELSLKVPLVVRLEGTNATIGRKIINESGLKVIVVSDLDEAARQVVLEAKGEGQKWQY